MKKILSFCLACLLLVSLGSTAFAAGYTVQNQSRAVLGAAGVDERVRGEALTLQELCRVADGLEAYRREQGTGNREQE